MKTPGEYGKRQSLTTKACQKTKGLTLGLIWQLRFDLAQGMLKKLTCFGTAIQRLPDQFSA
jgi:hypothetical protein